MRSYHDFPQMFLLEAMRLHADDPQVANGPYLRRVYEWQEIHRDERLQFALAVAHAEVVNQRQDPNNISPSVRALWLTISDPVGLAEIWALFRDAEDTEDALCYAPDDFWPTLPDSIVTGEVRADVA